MKAFVNDDCIGCGLCESACPDVFAIDEDGLAHAIEDEIDDELVGDVQDAATGCPMGAIEIA